MKVFVQHHCNAADKKLQEIIGSFKVTRAIGHKDGKPRVDVLVTLKNGCEIKVTEAGVDCNKPELLEDLYSNGSDYFKTIDFLFDFISQAIDPAELDKTGFIEVSYA